ncbi:guanine nucleotide-binding protein subunit beta-like protein 1 [Neocloeon triangulifer]|uniref:guanine nucleotide-binding protein subunit beta-like protein 1 n=1 Tax=Neocloeon triangulifer TaxID=2078957 RepID=UPI00286F9C09|nr:guanine nucleotide-binding protein subunit beta-like protein 1 [Neocloeon triangulifer]
MAAPPDPLYSFKGNQTQVHSLNFLLNATTEKLLSGTRNGHIFIWDLQSLGLDRSFASGDGACISLLAPQGSSAFVSHNRGDAVKKWSVVDDGSLKCTAKLPTSCLQFCAAQLLQSPTTKDQFVVFPSGEANCIQVDHFEQGTVCRLQWPEKVGNIMYICEAGCGQILALFEAGDLLLWDMRNSKHQLSHKLDLGGDEENPTAAMCMAFSKEKLLGIVGTSDNNINLFSKNPDFKHLTSSAIKNSGINHMSLRADQKLLAAACWDSKVRLFSLRGPESKTVLRPLAVLPTLVEDKSVSCTAFSDSPVVSLGNKTILAAAGEACSVLMWDVYN